MKPQQPLKKHRAPWKDFLIASALLVGLIGIFITVLSIPGDAGPITRAANTFKPDPEWKLVNEKIQPPALGCYMQVCPEVYREWETKVPLTKSDLKALIERSGWNMSFEEICEDYPHQVSSCWANGKVGEFDARLVIRAEDTGKVKLVMK